MSHGAEDCREQCPNHLNKSTFYLKVKSLPLTLSRRAASHTHVALNTTHMTTEYFVHQHSVVRQIWGKSDTILFIFAGAAAEFALNKSVDWLYFTGRLPGDPIGRLFSTVSYARSIVFAERQVALRTIDKMASIHAQIERDRHQTIPEWAYRDVLFLLVHYSISAFETLERKLTDAEKQEVLVVFLRIGNRMGIGGLPNVFEEWKILREQHLNENLSRSAYSDHLFLQYRKHLGSIRYRILLEVQTQIVPRQVRAWLKLRRFSLLHPFLVVYKVSRRFRLDRVLKSLLLPSRYKKEIHLLDSMNIANAAR